MKTTLGIIIFSLIVIVLTIVWLIVSGKDGVQNNIPEYGSQITRTGVVVCLPHKDKSGPQTLECTAGIKADDGTYFGLKAENNGPGQLFQTGGTVRVAGVLLKPDVTNIYDIVGKIKVSSVLNLSAESLEE